MNEAGVAGADHDGDSGYHISGYADDQRKILRDNVRALNELVPC